MKFLNFFRKFSCLGRRSGHFSHLVNLPWLRGVEGSYLAPAHERNTLRMNLCVIEYPMGVCHAVLLWGLLFSTENHFSSSGK